MYRRTLTISWDGLGEDDDDHFFESNDRLSTVVPQDLASSGSDDEVEFEDSRRSFSASVSIKNSFRGLEVETAKTVSFSNPPSPPIIMEDYGMWMAEPGDVKERRKRLLQGMGLTSSKELIKLTSTKVVRAISRKVDACQDSKPTADITSSKEELKREDKQEPEPSNSPPIMLLRSRSDGDIQFFSVNTKKRKEQLLGDVSKQRLTRTFSGVLGPATRICQYMNSAAVMAPPYKGTSKSSPPQNRGETPSSTLPNGCADSGFASFFLIKNLDTGKEFIVKESNEEGMWNKLSDLQTGKQLSMEEFEKSVGYSPVVKELMRRVNVSTNDERKLNVNAYLTKSFRYSKKTGVALLKNIKEVANSMSVLKADKEPELAAPVEQKQNKNSSQWIKVRQQGKIHKEFTALQLCQEIQAHEGSIWTIRFSVDGRYLGTAGEDRVIHVWEVQECDVMSIKQSDDPNSVNDTPSTGSNSDRPPLPVMTHMQSERRKKGKTSNKKKGNSLPDYVNVPETVFALSEKPVCTLNGHQDDVLDLSWSSSQQLLSSSMDKTVRLWDIETQSCLKMFAHNDYVTCIHFNPVDDDHFISGSLDGKVRIWNVSDRKVVDWTDLHEMVTAACYSPDGKVAISPTFTGFRLAKNRVHLNCSRIREQAFTTSCQDEDSAQDSSTDPGVGASFSSSSPSIRDGDSSSMSSSGRFDGSTNQGNNIIQSTAWGMVIVTASSGGEIRVYQNFGMPLKASRPTTLF